MFDDRITVESPGILPGIVRLSNLRTVHFSRNPKIAEFLHQYDYVQEFGEGIDRMFKEMENAGLPAPQYTDNAFMLNATIRNGEVNFDVFNKNERLVYKAIAENASITRTDLIEALDISARTIDRTIKSLKNKKAIERVGSDKTGHWKIIN